MRLSTDTEDGRFLAYASIIDNRTGDPVFAPGIPVPETDPAEVPPATVAQAAFDLLGLLGEDAVPAFQEAAKDIDDRGMESVLDELVSELPEFVSRIPDGVRIDFGDRLVLDDGSIASGSDLYVLEPDQEEAISHENPVSPSGGRLDRNSNEDCREEDPHPSETVSWPAGKSPRGSYYVWVETRSGCGGDKEGKPYMVEVLEGGVVKETWHEESGAFTNPHDYDY